ncbi:ORF2 protein [Cacao swollen shoot Ghana N virus]|uniref:ORF2 protein n=1 Tax=Cacao swollen shoot Ghana N virus TaxID=2056884 RepID=A0A2H4U950_9VIRU|nr:ORF2 protein [Cacao swollen shoot Ghana N virus]ATZ69485.1 ORF2 protein [Cacao swollen shoot Ghana N virus]
MNSRAYQQALIEAEKVDPPAVGITTSTGTSASQGFKTIIKQNNVQLLLLAQIADRLEELAADQKKARQEKAKEVSVPEDLISKLQSLSIKEPGEGSKPKREGKGILYGFKDPYKILAEEKAKLRK